MINGILIIIAILVGFYLGRYSEINKKVLEKIEDIKLKVKEKKYPPKVIRTDEVALEKEKEQMKKSEKITLEEIFKE